MVQGLQHGQSVLVCAAMIRTSERENAEFGRHVRNSIRGDVSLFAPRQIASARRHQRVEPAKTFILGSCRAHLFKNLVYSRSDPLNFEFRQLVKGRQI